ncbi:hypothetical protein ACLKA7_001223 [Drosophila subpalustris]
MKNPILRQEYTELRREVEGIKTSAEELRGERDGSLGKYVQDNKIGADFCCGKTSNQHRCWLMHRVENIDASISSCELIEQHGGISATRADGTFLTGIVTCTSQRFQRGKSPRQRARSLKNDNSNDICDACVCVRTCVPLQPQHQQQQQPRLLRGNPSEPSTAPGRQRRRSHAKCEEQRSSNEPSAEAEKRHLSFHVVISG